MFEKTKKTLISIIAAALLAGCASQNKPWMNISPGYAPKREVSTVRVEGGTQVTPTTSIYGFTDLDSSPQDKTDLNSSFAYLRAMQDLGAVHSSLKDVQLVAEYHGGTGIEDTLRFGVGYTPHIADGNFTLLKYLPFETQGSYGPQVGLFTSQQITDELGASLLINYDLDPKTIYGEAEINYKFADNFSMFLQGRGFGAANDFDIEPVIGIRYSISF